MSAHRPNTPVTPVEIQPMKITDVEPFHISVPYDFGNTAENAAAAQWAKMETLFVKVTTNSVTPKPISSPR
jgi:hypothetical protein